MPISIDLRRPLTMMMLAASTAGAQTFVSSSSPTRGAGPDSIPRELVTALLRTTYGGGGEIEFFVGKVPPVVEPYLYVPPGARILGGYSSFTGATVAMVVRNMSYQDVGAIYGREQPKLGWSPPPSPGDLRGWGFIPAPQQAGMTNGLEFCHIGQSLQIQPSQEGTNTYIIAQVQNLGGRCTMMNRSLTGGRTTVQTVLPTVTNPLGVNMNPQACSQPFVPVVGTTAITERLETNDSPAKTLDFFAKQLADSGWTPAPASPSARRQFARPDSAGNSRELTLTATQYTSSSGGICLEASMSVRVVPATRVRR